jgi:beta-1,4-mannosyl-glycoprotein beta-1,4-N-acetylglucosaminyltransferase
LQKERQGRGIGGRPPGAALNARVFDCFLFNDELDLLEIRLNELAPAVDRFVLAEAPLTFSGRPKPLHFRDNRARFAAFEPKLVHVVVEGGPELTAWRQRERQCNALIGGLRDARPDDIVLLSDADEIVSRRAIDALRDAPPAAGEVVCFELRMFNFFLNLEIDEPWLRSGPRAALLKDIRTMERLRKVRGPSSSPFKNAMRGLKASLQMGRVTRRRVVAEAGWHFSYLGGEAAIRNKLQSYAAHDKVPADLLDAERLAERIRSRRSISNMGSGRMIPRPIDDSFPSHLQAHPERYAHLIATDAVP